MPRLLRKALMPLLAPLFLQADDQDKESCESLAVGGQAVMEGVMMRNGANLSLAVRQPDGVIVVDNTPWFSFDFLDFLRRPYLRGFPVLLETMINGIKALNTSAELAMSAEGEELKPWQLALTLVVAIGFAILLFVVTPHLLTIWLNALDISGGVEGLSFHLWDGLIKFMVFLAYILLISRLPDIRRVFEYHGAEHKTIHSYEAGDQPVTVASARSHPRMHPRCGTTFLLFVLSIAIILHAILVPLILLFWVPENPVLKHSVIIFIKLLLMIPISSLAYEAIRIGARLEEGPVAKLVRAPGMLLQLLTTREPDSSQLEVAMVALREALGAGPEIVATPEYQLLETK